MYYIYHRVGIWSKLGLNLGFATEELSGLIYVIRLNLFDLIVMRGYNDGPSLLRVS